MRVICSWCNTVLVYDENDDGITSHGICLTCGMKMLEEQGIDPNLFLVHYMNRKQPKCITADTTKGNSE